MPPHRFPPPWSIEEQAACFTIHDFLTRLLSGFDADRCAGG
jgi:hypothetical protein